jgi:peroxiredoxin
LYDAKGWFFAKRITFIIDKEGIIQKIIRKVSVHSHAVEILEIITDLLE